MTFTTDQLKFQTYEIGKENQILEEAPQLGFMEKFHQIYQ